jgi:hypothetical protein
MKTIVFVASLTLSGCACAPHAAMLGLDIAGTVTGTPWAAWSLPQDTVNLGNCAYHETRR